MENLCFSFVDLLFGRAYRVKLILAFSLASFCVYAQDPQANQEEKKDIYELSLEQLWNTSIEIASKKVQTQDEAPSIVTVITSEEIQKYGYKDLSDVLRMVPGFEFGVDVVGLYGLGFRGIWAHEGKALFMINGMIVNCFGFGNANYFGTYPIALVDRIEIIRGPGSAIHGGFSEVAVINVLTKTGKMLDGAELRGSIGSMSGNLLTNGTLAAGLEKGSLNLSAMITSNSTPVSASTYSDFFGGSLEMGNENTWRKFTGIYLTGSFEKLKFGYNRSYTSFLAQDAYTTILPQSTGGLNTIELNNRVESLNLQYEIKLTDKVSLSPKLDLASGNPISTATSPNYSGTSSQLYNPIDFWQNESANGNRYQFETEMQLKISTRASINAGLGYQYNRIRNVDLSGNPGLQTSSNPADTVSSYGRGTEFAYLQYSIQTNILGFTVGGRYEITPFGHAFCQDTLLKEIN